MSFQTARDIPLQIRSSNAASERRISPSWTLAHLKTKLEPITGIPPSSQKLTLKVSGRSDVVMNAADDDAVKVGHWELLEYAEIYVDDTRPLAARNLDLTDLSAVEKYVMPEDTYDSLPSTVLAYKRNNNLGRFDPRAPEIERQKIDAYWADTKARNIETGKRCQLGTDSSRRGAVEFVGEVPEIPGLGGPWVGVALDEPLGKNDGSVGGNRYFKCQEKKGVFVRPERVEIGDYGVLIEDEMDSDMEEI